MNKITKLFLDHLRSQDSAKEAVLDWVSALDACDEEPGGTKVATMHLMAAMAEELHTFMDDINLFEAVYAFQEDPEA
jgi:hypothetical protein